MGTFLSDLRFAIRNLRKTPAFPLAAIGTLALGIGATTAIFSTVNAVLLRPLPYPKADDLYAIRTTLTDGRVTTGMVAASELVRLNDPKLPIEHAVGMQQFDFTLLRDDGTPLRSLVYGVTEGFFELFGLPMTYGGFTHEHYVQTQSGPPSVVISYRMWKELYNSDPAVVGKPIRFTESQGATVYVAGVAHKDFDTPHNANFWFTRVAAPNDVNHSLEGFMRLKPGASIESVKSQMAAVMEGLARDFPASAKARAYVVRPLVEQIVGDLKPILIVVLSATALLLILACVNVTNLLLARGAARAREMAVRVALGAGRGRIIRQLLTESVLLATLGSLVGLLVASLGVRLLLSVGASKLPRLESVPFDGRVLMFALVALFVSGVLVGFAPALRLAGTDVKTLMNESSRSTTGGRGTARWLTAMTVIEIAVAITLVAGAGWLIRSFANLRAIEPGFAAENRLVFDLSLQGPKYQNPTMASATIDDLLGRLRSVQGVVGAGGASGVPLRGSQEDSVLAAFRGEPFDPARPPGMRRRLVTSGYFKVMGTKIVAGRDFSADDRNDMPPVCVINRSAVNRYLKGRDPIGVQFSFGYPTVQPNNELTIVGVVEDVRQKTLIDTPEPAFYVPYTQARFPRMSVVVHTKTADNAAVQSALRDEMRKFDPQVAVDFEDVSEVVSTSLARQELGMTLMLLFGAVAVALAAVGIYGVVAYAAAQRRNEVATRLALGASSLNVFWLVLRQGILLAAVGTAIGLTIAYLSGRVVANNIYDVKASDPLILSAATLIVVTIAVLATMIPAYRASRLDPARALRAE